MNNTKNLTKILFILIFTISNCTAIFIRSAFGPLIEINLIEKMPFEMPSLQKIQQTKDFSFRYKVGEEFSENVEEIAYWDKKNNSGRTRGIQREIYKNKILTVKANGDYLLSRSWAGTGRANCESPNLYLSWYDKQSNLIESITKRFNCKEQDRNLDNYEGRTFYKLDNLTLDIPLLQEKRDGDSIEKIETTYTGITNYKNRVAFVLLLKFERKGITKNNYALNANLNELIYLDQKSRLPLLKKRYSEDYLKRLESNFSLNNLLFSLDGRSFHIQSIHTYTYPPGYLE